MVSKIQGYSIKPLPDDILVINMEKGYRKSKKTGLILLDDSTFNDSNIKPRWCQVYKKGYKIDFLKEGQWVLVEHGRWSTGVKIDDKEKGEVYVQKIDKNAILLISDEYDSEYDRLEKLL